MKIIEQQKGQAFNLYLQVSKGGWLQKRDLEMLLTIYKFRFAQFSSLATMYFPKVKSKRAVQRRLQKLYQWRLVERMRHWVSADATEFVYLLGDVGAYCVANYLGKNVDELGWKSSDKNIRLAYMQHYLDAMKLFLQLRRLCILTKFETEITLKGDGFNFRPDAYAKLQKGGSEYRIFFEVDRGTEVELRIQQKCKNYEAYRKAKGQMPWVVFVCEKDTRARKLQQWADRHGKGMYRAWTFVEMEKGIGDLKGVK